MLFAVCFCVQYKWQVWRGESESSGRCAVDSCGVASAGATETLRRGISRPERQSQLEPSSLMPCPQRHSLPLEVLMDSWSIESVSARTNHRARGGEDAQSARSSEELVLYIEVPRPSSSS